MNINIWTHGILASGFVFLAMLGTVTCLSRLALNCSCPSGWQLWGNACYRLTESRQTWDEACSVCHTIGGQMSAPRSIGEIKFMGDLAQHDDSNYYVWIACNDIEVEGDWTCDGQEGSKPFLKWQPEQPDNYGANQDCAAMSPGYDGGMDNGDCGYPNKAFCVRQAACTPPPTQTRHFCFFTDTHGRILNSTCLLDHVIREFTTDSVTACGSACVEETECRSLNIKKGGAGKKICQLNNSKRSEANDDFQNTAYFCLYSDVCFG